MTSDEGATEETRTGRFEPGSHLRVRRRWGYIHHGIYVHDDRVIQFGGRITDKPQATISAVSLAEFEGDGVAEAVIHGGHRGWFPLLPALPEAQAANRVIAQAEWLVANYSPGKYHLVGNNCENIANWCAAGWYPESHQVRAGIGVVVLVQTAALFIASYRQRTSLRMSRWMVLVGILSVVGAAGGMMRNRHSKRFWQEYGLKWRTREQAEKGLSSPDDPS